MPEGRTVKADIVLSKEDIAHVHVCEPLNMRRLGDRPVDIDETIDGGDAARDHIRPGRFGPSRGHQRPASVRRVEEHPYEAIAIEAGSVLLRLNIDARTDRLRSEIRLRREVRRPYGCLVVIQDVGRRTVIRVARTRRARCPDFSEHEMTDCTVLL